MVGCCDTNHSGLLLPNNKPVVLTIDGPFVNGVGGRQELSDPFN
jgi:hypothetical protein